MPEPVTVWAVELHVSRAERKGTLSLEEGALRFVPASGGAEVRISCADIVKVRRLRGSPVLMVVHRGDRGPGRTAFYFAQPPPLEPATSDLLAERGPLRAMRRDTKRKARRRNVGYLGLYGREKKSELLEWERAVRETAGGV